MRGFAPVQENCLASFFLDTAGGAVAAKPAAGDTTPLRKVLVVTAIYAGFARFAGSWEHGEIFQKAADRLEHKSALFKGDDTFRSMYRGHLTQSIRLDALEELFPTVRVKLARQHPLAELLCDRDMTVHGIYERLERIRPPFVRDVARAERRIKNYFESAGSALETSRRSIDRLQTMGTPSALYALVALRRLRQIREADDLASELEHAVWTCLGRAMDRSPTMFVSAYALAAAFRHMLTWQPGGLGGLMFHNVDKLGPIPDIYFEAVEERWNAARLPWDLTREHLDHWRDLALDAIPQPIPYGRFQRKLIPPP